MEIRQFMRCRLFQGMEEEKLAEHLKRVSGTVHHYRKGEVIINLADFADQIGLILRGTVSVQKISEGGSIMQVAVKKEGEMIGEAACFSHARLYPCELIAEKDTDMYVLTRKEMLELLSADPVLLENFLTELATQTYMLQNRIEILTYKGTDQRLACFLIRRMNMSGKKRVPLPGTMVRLAQMLNVSRTTLHRELRRLEEGQVLRYENKVFEILDPSALSRILERDFDD